MSHNVRLAHIACIARGYPHNGFDLARTICEIVSRKASNRERIDDIWLSMEAADEVGVFAAVPIDDSVALQLWTYVASHAD